MAQPARNKGPILRDYLLDHIVNDSLRCYGRRSRAWLEYVADAWLNDANNSAHRYQEMYDFAGKETVRSSRILDMASGCGTFVYYGLINGVDVWGIEPEDWKNTFNKMKADVYGYPEEWKQRFIKAVGENLPFPDASFDFASSYQTMEHVQDIERCLTEMLRVARVAVFLKSPDYSGTFEGHYRLPWLPLFPRPLARFYLRLLGRRTLGLDTLQYITKHRVKRILRKYPVRIHDRNGFIVVKQRIDEKLGLRKYGILGSGLSYLATGAYLLLCKSCRLFRREKHIDLIISKSI